MKEGINRVRASNFKKATEIRQKGLKTAVHGLPAPVKIRIDQLLNQKTTPNEVLKTVSSEFPDVTLPSVVALRNYKNKYLIKSLTNMDVPETQVALDKQKLAMQSAVLTELSNLITITIPKLRQGLDEGLKKEDMVKMPMKLNSDRAKVLAELIALVMKELERGGAGIWSQTDTEELTGQLLEDEGKEELSDKLARILSKRAVQFSVKRTRTTTSVQRVRS